MHSAPLRPLSFGEILDGAFVLYRRHYRVLLQASSITLLPVAFGWIARALLPRSAPGAAAGALLSLFELAVAFAAYAVVTHLIAAAYQGGNPSLAPSVRAVAGRLGSILITSLLVTVLTVVGMMLLLIPGLLVAGRYFAVVPAAVLEGLGWRAARRRSRDLARDAEMQVLGVVCVAMLIFFLPYLAAGVVGLDSMIGAPATGALEALWSVIATPITTGIYVLLYFDRRVRTEGLDVQVATDSLQPVAA